MRLDGENYEPENIEWDTTYALWGGCFVEVPVAKRD
jgi:hypothetical protein